MEGELERLRASQLTLTSESSPQEDLKAWIRLLDTPHGAQRLDVQLDSPGVSFESPRQISHRPAFPAKGLELNEQELTQLGVNFVLSYAVSHPTCILRNG